MTKPKIVLSAAILAAALGGAGIAMPIPQALAQAASPTQQSAPARPERPSHIEGRIAYLKAELKITPAQEAQFDKVAQAMRQNDQERRQNVEQLRNRDRSQQPNALQRLETRARFAATRAQEEDRFLTAFRPLYQSLSDAQKKTADELVTHGAQHHHWRG